MSKVGQDTLKTRRSLSVGGKDYDYFRRIMTEDSAIPSDTVKLRKVELSSISMG